MAKAAVIPASGIGDALLMMIASHRLQMAGHAVTTFHPKLVELSPWFEDHRLEATYDDLSDFDLIVVQNDNSDHVKELRRRFERGELPNLSIFYPTFEPHKHGEPSAYDQVFDSRDSMADNIAKATARIVKSSHISKNNGLTPPPGLVFNQYPQRILIHPTAGEASKVWPLDHFIWVAHKLEELGYEPVFTLSPAERIGISKLPFPTPKFETLNDIASYLYESGGVIGNDSMTGHLASNFHLPTVIVANCHKRMRLWRPGWLNGEVVTPPRWIPNFKGSRIRNLYWRRWVRPRRVLKSFTSQMAALPSSTV